MYQAAIAAEKKMVERQQNLSSGRTQYGGSSASADADDGSASRKGGNSQWLAARAKAGAKSGAKAQDQDASAAAASAAAAAAAATASAAVDSLSAPRDGDSRLVRALRSQLAQLQAENVRLRGGAPLGGRGGGGGGGGDGGGGGEGEEAALPFAFVDVPVHKAGNAGCVTFEWEAANDLLHFQYTLDDVAGDVSRGLAGEASTRGCAMLTDMEVMAFRVRASPDGSRWGEWTGAAAVVAPQALASLPQHGAQLEGFVTLMVLAPKVEGKGESALLRNNELTDPDAAATTRCCQGRLLLRRRGGRLRLLV
jgi:hypothetical protein